MSDAFVPLLDPGHRESGAQRRAAAPAATPPPRGIPEVTRPRQRFGFAGLIAGAAVATAGLVYAAGGDSDRSPAAAIEALPPRAAPPAPTPVAPVPPADETLPPAPDAPPVTPHAETPTPDGDHAADAANSARAAADAARQRAAERRRSPLLVASAPGAGASSGASSVAALDLGGAEGRFLAAAAGSGATRARLLPNQRALIAQGTLIAGVLETAINSDLPGMVRAVVAADVRGFDGSSVLIPRGSRLIGQYRSGLAIGQRRAFVVWTRLITPTGVSLDLASPGTDALGRAGLTGEVDRHFGERFGAAILLSIVGSAGQAAANAAGGGRDITLNAAASTADIADTALRSSADIPPTVKVRAGTPIRIFVAHDLDFSGLGGGGS